jgi:hypothetical protein
MHEFCMHQLPVWNEPHTTFHMGNWYTCWATKLSSFSILRATHFGSSHSQNRCLVAHPDLTMPLLVQPIIANSEAQDLDDQEDDYEILHPNLTYLCLCLC